MHCRCPEDSRHLPTAAVLVKEWKAGEVSGKCLWHQGSSRFRVDAARADGHWEPNVTTCDKDRSEAVSVCNGPDPAREKWKSANSS